MEICQYVIRETIDQGLEQSSLLFGFKHVQSSLLHIDPTPILGFRPVAVLALACHIYNHLTYSHGIDRTPVVIQYGHVGISRPLVASKTLPATAMTCRIAVANFVWLSISRCWPARRVLGNINRIRLQQSSARQIRLGARRLQRDSEMLTFLMKQRESERLATRIQNGECKPKEKQNTKCRL